MVTERRFLFLTAEILGGDSEFVLELPQSAVAAMALELALLLQGLSKSLRIQAKAGKIVVLTLIDNDRVSKAVVGREHDDARSFAIGRNQAEYLQSFCLRAYRDQMAEVNHVHIEGRCENIPFDLTIMFEVYRESMTPEEVEKLMRD